MYNATKYRGLGHGWTVSYWPEPAPATGPAIESFGELPTKRDLDLLQNVEASIDFGIGQRLDPRATLIRQRPLPFYNRDDSDRRYQLVEVFRFGHPVTERARAIRILHTSAPACLRWIPLAWESGTIHSLNEKIGVSLKLADRKTAGEYLDFFTGSIESDDGTFDIVRMEPIEILRVGEVGPDVYVAKADILYGGALFHATFHMKLDGSMVMVDDLPYPDPALPLEFRWFADTRRIQTATRSAGLDNPDENMPVGVTASDFIHFMKEPDGEDRLRGHLHDKYKGVVWDRWQGSSDPLLVAGSLFAAAGTHFESDWRLTGNLFKHRKTNFSSVQLSRCIFRQGFRPTGVVIREWCRLDHARIEGTLELNQVGIENLASTKKPIDESDQSDSESAVCLNLRSIDVTGDLRIRSTVVKGAIVLRHAQIGGQIALHGATVTQTLDAFGVRAAAVEVRPGHDSAATSIGGNLDLSGADVPAHIDLRRAHIGRDFRVVTPIKIGSIYIGPDGAVGDGETRRSQVGGVVEILNVSVNGHVEVALDECESGVRLRNVECASLTASGVLGPGLQAAGLRARGDVVIRDIVVPEPEKRPDGPRIDLQHARIGGNLRLVGPETYAAQTGEITLGGATVQGRLTLSRVVVAGPLDLADVTVTRDIKLDDVEVNKSLVMRHLVCRGSAHLEGATVAGDVELENARIDGTLSLWLGRDGPKASIGGRLLLNALVAGALMLTGSCWGDSGEEQKEGREAGTWYTNVPFVFGLFFLLIPVVAFVVIAAVNGGRAAADAMTGAVEYDSDWALLWTGLRWVFWTIVGVILVLRMKTLWGMIYSLCEAPGSRGMLVAPMDQEGRGGLFEELRRLWWAAFSRASMLVALATIIVATHVGSELGVAAAGGRVPEAPELPWMALLFAVVWLALVNLRACGAAGYWLSRQPPPDEPRSLGLMSALFGVDNITYAVAIGLLWINVAFPSHRALGYTLTVLVVLGVAAMVWWRCRTAESTLRMGFLDSGKHGQPKEGQLDGTDADDGPRRISQLRLDAAQVTLSYRDWLQVVTLNRLRPAAEGHDNDRVRCNLERARVRYLRIEDPIPDFVDISNLVVDKWKLPSDPADSRSYQYLNLLSHAAEFSTDSFTALESSLRSGGDRESAEEINRSMQRHTQWRERRGVQTATMLLLSLSGYGTKRARLIGVMALWLLSTAFWFAADYDRSVGIGLAQKAEFLQVSDSECMPGRQGAVPAASSKQGSQAMRASPPSCKKSARAELFGAILAPVDAPLDRLGHGFALAMRYHVPILLWDIRPFIQPIGPGMWVYVTLVEAIHWILWPLLIASVVSAILPKRDG